MKDIIKFNYDSQNDRQTTSARSLWEYLDKPYTEFPKWFDKYKEYGFTKNEDYRELRIKIRTSNGAEHEATDYEITFDTAKELAMLQKTEKGKRARKYLIELEKQWNTPEAVMARALKMADTKIVKLQTQIEEDKPKVLFANAVSASNTTILIGELAKFIKQNGVDMGEKRLFKWLRDNNYLISRKGTDYNAPTQYSMELGLFAVKETSIAHSDGHVTISKTTKVTGKGQQYFISKFLGRATDEKGA